MARIPRRTQWRQTPLLRAAEHGNLGVVRVLLERGANVNATEHSTVRARPSMGGGGLGDGGGGVGGGDCSEPAT
jgi:hypothetical protein